MARLGGAGHGTARHGRRGVARQGAARPSMAGEERRGWARHGVAGRGMELKEVAMDNERRDDGLDVAWCAFDAAVARLKRAVDDLESVLGRKEEAAHE